MPNPNFHPAAMLSYGKALKAWLPYKLRRSLKHHAFG